MINGPNDEVPLAGIATRKVSAIQHQLLRSVIISSACDALKVLFSIPWLFARNR